MNAARVACTWLGRICLLAIPFIIICALVYPAGLAPLDQVVCPEGLTLDKRTNVTADDESSISSHRIVCVSSDRLVVVTGKLIAVTAVFFLLAVGFYLLRSRITPAELKAPPTHQTR